MDIFPMQEDKKPLVSIGIPTYNRADGYLRECLASALNQTYENIEVIVSDNCSTDSTSALMQSISDSRLKYIRHEKNIGPANNFNYCLKQARGVYFLLLHDDDLIDPDFVEICMEAARYRTDIGLIRTGTRVIDHEGNVLTEVPNMAGGLTAEDFFRSWFSCKTAWYLPSTLFNTKALRNLGGFHSKRYLLQDAVAVVQLAVRHQRIDIRDVKASFRKHQNELTFASKVSDWCEDFLALMEIITNLAHHNKSELRSEGMRFFAKLCYNRARAVSSPIKRLFAYLIVMHKFRYRYLP